MSNTLNALSSVAKLSFGMAMSMSSGSLGSSSNTTTTNVLPTIDTQLSPSCGRRHVTYSISAGCTPTPMRPAANQKNHHVIASREHSLVNTSGVEIVIATDLRCSADNLITDHVDGVTDNNRRTDSNLDALPAAATAVAIAATDIDLSNDSAAKDAAASGDDDDDEEGAGVDADADVDAKRCHGNDILNNASGSSDMLVLDNGKTSTCSNTSELTTRTSRRQRCSETLLVASYC
jgi:hypothetical protein